MVQLAQTQLHRVYLVERRGDTLVVRPRGDAAGFSLSLVNTEMGVITGVIASGITKHLIVDLSGGNYFGSVILGALVQLGNQVRSQGGRIALAGASSDMQEILRLMKLDQMWELFRDLPAALRAIATIPFGERMWARRRTFGWLVGIIAIVALIIYYPRVNYGRVYYKPMNELWTEIESRRDLAGVEEWDRLKARSRKLIEPIARHMEKLGKSRPLKSAERDILYISRDYWIPTMDRDQDLQLQNAYRRMVQFHFRSAEAQLESRPLPGLREAPDMIDLEANPPMTSPLTPASPLIPADDAASASSATKTP